MHGRLLPRVKSHKGVMDGERHHSGRARHHL